VHKIHELLKHSDSSYCALQCRWRWGPAAIADHSTIGNALGPQHHATKLLHFAPSASTRCRLWTMARRAELNALLAHSVIRTLQYHVSANC
jgi:hypothetical protein